MDCPAFTVNIMPQEGWGITSATVLNYADEEIAEGYFSLGILRGASLTLDYQYLRHPAYNADRGPLSIVGARLHWEY